MRHRTISVFGGCALATIAFVNSAHAVILPFTDRGAFTTAAGGINVSESFNGFAADAPFRTATVAANGFTLAQEGTQANFRNLVDVPPLGFTEHNGTAYVSSYTSAAEGATAGTDIRVAFPTPVRAAGATSTTRRPARGWSWTSFPAAA